MVVDSPAVERKLAAIFAADVAEYSRLMGVDEVGTLRRLQAYRAILDELVAIHHGRIFNTAGDSVSPILRAPPMPSNARSRCSRRSPEENANRPPEEQMRFRIGVHVGDVIVEGSNLYGDSVNIAARLEALAEPGGVCLSGAVRDQVGARLPVTFTTLGDQRVKNIAEPMRAFMLDGKRGWRCAPGACRAAGPMRRLAFGALAAVDWLGAHRQRSAWWLRLGAPIPTGQTFSAPRLSMVVLPFANLSNDPQQEYFADGITDDLTTDVSRIAGSVVIARNTAFTYKGKEVDARKIGRELGGALCRRRQRAALGKGGADQRPAGRRRNRRSALGRTLRPRSRRSVCAAKRNHSAGRPRPAIPAGDRRGRRARPPIPTRSIIFCAAVRK